MKECADFKNNLAEQTHRQGHPKQGVHFDMLFSKYMFHKQDSASTWPDDDLGRAEFETQNHL